MKSIFYAYLIIVLVLSGCSSGKTTFERGNYYEAVITAINRLRRNSDHKKSVETLRQAYPMAVAFYEDRAKTSLASSERFKWSEVVRSYTAINTMYDEIKRCPGCLAVIPNPVNYLSKLQEARQNAAEENYAAGILALQTGTRESAKQAYGYFKVANDYAPGYKEVTDYLEAALFAATVKIIVEPIPVHSKTVGVSAEFFNDKISEFVHGASISEFVRFYTRAEAQKIKLNPDHIVQLEFDEFTVGEVYKHEKEIHLVKDSIVMATYVSTSADANQSNTNTSQNTTARTGLVTTGTSPVVIAKQNPTNSNTPVTSPAVNTNTQASANQAAEAEKQRLEQRQRELAEKAKAEREAAERERIARETAERERIAREAAEKERIEKMRADAERAAKEAADKAAAEKALADKTLAEKAQIERERAERERMEREQAEKARIERERVEKERMEKELADKVKSEKAKADREQAEKAAAEKAKADKEKADKEKADRERAEKEKADKEKADKEKADKEKADKEKADKERAEKEKTAKEKYVDPTIHSTDTLNVTDPVLICHVPPGNKANARTLRINRSALKAHLAHGDAEGGCETDQQKGKPEGNDKGKPKEELKDNSQPDNKGKAKGTGKLQTENNEPSLLFSADEMLLASRDNSADAMFRYLHSVGVPADTNKVYGTVKATLYHYTKTTTSKGIVSFRIIDAKTGALLSVQKMPGEFVWKSEWATFNGDERALSAEQLKLTRQKEQPAPKAQDLFIEFTRPIYDQITTKLKDFYKGY